MKQKIALLYLNTGAGHISCAKTLKKQFETLYGNDVQVDLVYGFERSSNFFKFSIEKMYQLTCLYFPFAFSLLYLVAYIPIVWYMAELAFGFSVKKYLTEKFTEEKYDKIVSMHYLLVAPARSAAFYAEKQTGKKSVFFVGVTDPFTVHPLWGFKKDLEYITFSDKAKQTLQKKIDPARIRVFPFFIDDKCVAHSPQTVQKLKQQYEFSLDKKLLLIAGGGDGLPRMEKLVKTLIESNPNYAIAVVCGRNEKAFKNLSLLASCNPAADLRVYGFVPFMPDLITMADCVVSKGGPSTVFEILAARKPVLFVSYIFGQELGNIQFVIKNGAGWYIKNHKKIAEQIKLLFSDAELFDLMRKNLETLAIVPDVKPCAEYIYNFA